MVRCELSVDREHSRGIGKMTRLAIVMASLAISSHVAANTTLTPPEINPNLLEDVRVPAIQQRPAPPPEPLTLKNIGQAKRIDIRLVSVGQVIDLIYAEMLQTPYVLAPEVVADTRTVSFRLDRGAGDIRTTLANFLDSLGFGVSTKQGVDYVFKRGAGNQGSTDKDVFVYSPKYRSADYLSSLVAPLFSGSFTTNRTIHAPPESRSQTNAPITSAAGRVDQSSDTMVFMGSAKEIELLKKVLPQVDLRQGEVSIRAWVYEVSSGNDRSSGFSIALNVLNSKLSIGAGTIDPNANALRLSSGSLDVAIAALDSDSRFRVVTSPNMRAYSGKHGRMNVGQSVPVISSVSYPSSTAAPVQSVAYQDAGVIFDVLPTVRGAVTDIEVTVEISDFQKTSTGVNNTPTKNTRKFETATSLSDGDVVVMGGLGQTKGSEVESGLSFLPSFLNSRSATSARSDLVLVLQVVKIQ